MKRKIVATVATVVVALVATLIVPWSFGFPHRGTGDQHVLDATGKFMSLGYRREAAVAIVPAHGEPAFAGWGSDEHTVFEIGSLTKTFTAQLLADAIERKELTFDTTAEQVFPELKGTSVGKVTMEQLATHTSGLPRLIKPNAMATILRKDPYAMEVPEFLDELAHTEVTPGKYAYSNAGFALLGQAIAKKAGKDYPTLVRERLLTPLGMNETTVPTEPQDLPADHTTGFTDNGLPAQAWTMRANAPAGSIRSTAHDMALWLQAVRDGKAPGSKVKPTKPRADSDGAKIGLAWVISEKRGATVTWHNGGTGGFTSFAGFNANGTGVIALNNTTTSSDFVMNYLIDEETGK